MTLLDRVRDLVRSECLAPTNAFGPVFLEEHLGVVAALCRRLGPPLGADPVRLELAAWLHDLAAVRDLGCLTTHAEAGAALAREVLPRLGAPEADVQAVSAAIAAHSAPVQPGAGPAEAVALAAADVLSHLERPAYWFHYLYRVRGMDLACALAWWRGRVEGAYPQLPPAARAVGAEAHARAAWLLEAPRR
ncbi:MAG: HD domain-containing protein [Anaeromyxobacter sp.]